MSGEVVEIRTLGTYNPVQYRSTKVKWGEVVQVQMPVSWIIVADDTKIYIDVLFRSQGSGMIYASPLGIVEV